MTEVLPDNWEEVPLKSVVSKLVDGSHNPPKKQDSGKPMLSARNIENNEIVFDTYRYIDPDDFEAEHKRTRVQPDDVLLTIVGTIGRAAVVSPGLQDFTLQRSVAVLTPEGVLPKFLMYQLQAPHVQSYFEQNARGTAQKGVYLKTLGQTPVRVAPLADQKRIVSEIEKQFSRLDEAVANLKRVKANLKRYKAAVLKAAVGGKLTEEWRKAHPDVEPASKLLDRVLAERRAKWEEAELAKMEAKGKAPKNDKWKAKHKEPVAPDEVDLFDLPPNWTWVCLDSLLEGIEAGKSFKCDERPPNGGEVGVLKVSAVTWGTYDEHESKTCTRDDYVNENLFVRRGDFLFSRANTIDLVGACVIAEDVSKRVMLSDKILRFTFARDLAQWVLFCLRSRLGRGEIEQLATGNQESMRNIGQERIRRIRIPLPPEMEQYEVVNEIERRLSVMHSLEASINANLARAESMRQAILRQLFSPSAA